MIVKSRREHNQANWSGPRHLAGSDRVEANTSATTNSRVKHRCSFCVLFGVEFVLTKYH
jgi:hypothetical protein